MILDFAFAFALLDTRPPPSDLDNFPPATVCRERMSALAAHKAFLEARAGFFPGYEWEYNEAAASVRVAYSAWDWLFWAHTCGNEDGIRYSLDNLRRILGPENYYSGRMP